MDLTVKPAAGFPRRRLSRRTVLVLFAILIAVALAAVVWMWPIAGWPISIAIATLGLTHQLIRKM